MAWRFNSFPSTRTAEKIRSAAILAAISGANGIVFHLGHGGIPLDRTRLWSVFSGLARELMFIYPLIRRYEVNPQKYVSTKVNHLAFRVYRRGKQLFIIAVNKLNTLQKVDFKLKPALTGKAKVVFENRSLPLKNGGFTDFFTAFEPHVYQLELTESE